MPANQLHEMNVEGKTVLLRVDINVPIQNGEVTDDTRITRIVPTINDLTSRGAKVVVLSHFGRPKGTRVDEFSLAPVAKALSGYLGDTNLQFVSDCIGDDVSQAVDAMKPGSVIVCENLRFHAEEEAGDTQFARQLAALGDLYVNDAFSCSHRAHASIAGIPNYLPSCFGYAMQQELAMLEKVFDAPQRPVAALVGGSKVSTKMALLTNLVETMDILMIGGGMANTFLHAQGYAVGSSLCERDLADLARSILEKAAQSGCRILLPQDVVVAQRFAAHALCRVIPVDGFAEQDMALDVGPQTVGLWSQAIREANTLLWNGPAGAFEMAPFDNSTVSLARVIAAETSAGRLASVAGGGDTVSSLSHAGLTNAMTYVSTAGGAFLEWLEGKVLPGVQAIHMQPESLAS